MAERKSFWETLPGILTAIGGTIVAIATLLTALYTTGVIGNRKEPVSSLVVQSPSPAVSTMPASSTVKAEVTPVHSSEPTRAPTREPAPPAAEEVRDVYVMSQLEMGIDLDEGLLRSEVCPAKDSTLWSAPARRRFGHPHAVSNSNS
jgi:hypothetical protein